MSWWMGLIHLSTISLVYCTACHSSVLHFRLTRACRKKCIPPKYHEGDLSKGEAICLDRCVSKFMDVQDRAGKKLTTIFQQEQAAMAQNQS